MAEKKEKQKKRSSKTKVKVKVKTGSSSKQPSLLQRLLAGGVAGLSGLFASRGPVGGVVGGALNNAFGPQYPGNKPPDFKTTVKTK